MNRVHLWLAALQVVSLVAIGWLWSENRSQRANSKDVRTGDRESAASPKGQDGRFAVRRETGSGPKPGTPKRGSVDPGTDVRNDALGAETSRRPRTVSSGSSRVGGVGDPEENLPTENPPLRETGLIAAPLQPGSDSLIVNGGFDAELAPWLCEEGRVIRDPDDERNSLLEATPNESGFRLTQSFEPPAGEVPMTLSFRAQLSGESDLSGFDLMLLGQDDKPLTMTRVEAGKPGEWKKIEWKVSMPVAPASLRIGSSGGNGALRIDDVRLAQSTAAPESAQGQSR